MISTLAFVKMSENKISFTYVLVALFFIALANCVNAICFSGIPCSECMDCCDMDIGGVGFGVCMIGCGNTCR